MVRGDKTTERKTGVAAWNESAGIETRADHGTRQNKAAADKKRRKVLLVLLALLCVGCLVCMWPIRERITRGLWLKEGISYNMQAVVEDGADSSASNLSGAVDTVSKRLAPLDVSDATARQGEGSILVEFPWFAEQTEEIAQIIGGRGRLEFVRVDEIGDADALSKINAGTSNVQLQDGMFTSFLDGSSVTSVTVTPVAQKVYAITFTFNDEGAKKFADVTRELAKSNGSIAIVIDGKVLSAPSVSEEITGGQVSISGSFSQNEANAIKAVVDTGELPFATKLTGSEKTGPLVGKTMLWGMVVVTVCAIVCIWVVGFRKFGKLAVVPGGASVVYSLLLLGLMALFSRLNMFVLTVPGVVAGAIAGATTVVAAWRICGCFVARVESGASYRGAALSCAPEAMKPLAAPCAIVFVAALVFQFLPFDILRDFGLVMVFGAIAGVLTVSWYALTTLRLLASEESLQEHPEAWGIRSAAKDASLGVGVS